METRQKISALNFDSKSLTVARYAEGDREKRIDVEIDFKTNSNRYLVVVKKQGEQSTQSFSLFEEAVDQFNNIEIEEGRFSALNRHLTAGMTKYRQRLFGF